MPLTRGTIERLIAHSQADLETIEKKLDEKDIGADARSKDPEWRRHNATRRRLVRRLRSVKAVEEREAAALARREEKAAAAASSTSK